MFLEPRIRRAWRTDWRHRHTRRLDWRCCDELAGDGVVENADMKPVLLAALLVFGFSTVASSCDVGRSQEPSSGLLTRSPDRDGGEMAAIVGGTLELDAKRGCVLLSGKPVVWPDGTILTTNPPAVRLPGGLDGRPGDVITGGGGEVPATGIRETTLRIKGDLSSALSCAPDSAVIVFTARGDAMWVSSGIGAARASFENGYAACRMAQAGDKLAGFVQYLPVGGDREVAARRFLAAMQRVVGAALRPGNNFAIALQGCVEAVWPDGVPLPRHDLRVLTNGEKLTYPPGVVRPGETLWCVKAGHTANALVAPKGRRSGGVSDWGSGSAVITITTGRSGAVVASCR